MHINWMKFAVSTTFFASVATQHARADEIEYSMSKDAAEFPAVTLAASDDATRLDSDGGKNSALATPNTNWNDILSGEIAPFTMKAGALDASWRSFKADSDAMTQRNGRPFVISSAYYTRGRVVMMGGQSYLVTYREQQPLYDGRATYWGDFDGRSKPRDFTRETVLRLSLLNLRTLGNLNEIKPFDISVFEPVANSKTPEGRAVLRAQSSSNLKQLGIAVMQYSQEYDEVYPPMQSMYLLKKAVMLYVRDEKLFRQPSSNVFYVPNMSLSKKHLSAFESPSTTASIYEAQPDADGLRNVCYADGHVKAVSAEQWTKIKKDSGIK